MPDVDGREAHRHPDVDRLLDAKRKRGTETIRYRGQAVYAVHERYDRVPGGTPGPIMLEGMSPDRRWVLFAIDPMSSASLAADGLG